MCRRTEKSDVPIKCSLESQTEVHIFDTLNSLDQNQGLDIIISYGPILTHRAWTMLHSLCITIFDEIGIFYPPKDQIEAIGGLETSALELSILPASGETRLIVGEWATVKVTPTENDFYQNYR